RRDAPRLTLLPWTNWLAGSVRPVFFVSHAAPVVTVLADLTFVTQLVQMRLHIRFRRPDQIGIALVVEHPRDLLDRRLTYPLQHCEDVVLAPDAVAKQPLHVRMRIGQGRSVTGKVERLAAGQKAIE